MCVSFFAVCLVCEGQNQNMDALKDSLIRREVNPEKFFLRKSYAMPGWSVSELRGLLNEWNLESDGLAEGPWMVYLKGRTYQHWIYNVDIDGTPVTLHGRFRVALWNGGFDIIYSNVFASWPGHAILELPSWEVTPDYYVMHLSRKNRILLSKIYEEVENIFAHFVVVFDKKIACYENTKVGDFKLDPM